MVAGKHRPRNDGAQAQPGGRFRCLHLLYAPVWVSELI